MHFVSGFLETAAVKSTFSDVTCREGGQVDNLSPNLVVFLESYTSNEILYNINSKIINDKVEKDLIFVEIAKRSTFFFHFKS